MNLDIVESFNIQKTDIVKAFFEYDVIKINTKEYFTLSSGMKLPLYLDHRLIFSIPALRQKVADAWLTLIKVQLSQAIAPESFDGNTDIVFSGTATAGIAPAYALSSLSDTGFIYVRAKSKEYGLKSQVEGICDKKSKFIVIDDMVVSGESILKNAKVLVDLHGRKSILCATSISCHESEKMRDMFKKHHVPYFSLFTTAEIFTIALTEKIINQETFEVIMQFLKKFDKKS